MLCTTVFPLIKAFTDPDFNPEPMEDLDMDAEDFHLFMGDN